MRIDTWKDGMGRYRWKFIANNNKIIARCPKGYLQKQEMIIDLVYILSRDHDADLFKDKRGEWRFRFRNPNTKKNRIIAISTEGYNNRVDCVHASDLLLDSVVV